MGCPNPDFFMTLMKKVFNETCEKTHDEVLDDLKEEFKDYETIREIDYHELNSKKDKGEIDLIIPMDEKTLFYEVKSCVGLHDMNKAKEQLKRQKKTFENQTENIEYWIRLGSLEIKYTPFY